MDIEEKVMEALANAGISFQPNNVEIVGTDDGDSVQINYLEGRPAFDNLFAQVQLAIGDHFRGFEWRDSELSLTIFTDYQSAPDNGT